MKKEYKAAESQTKAVAHSTSPLQPRSGQEGQPLRRRAEKMARGKAAQSPENLESQSPEEVRQMLHELSVHQIELEMQNEELRRVQVELEAARAGYFELYDLAPVGYCTISERGLIREANLIAAALLGVTRTALIKKPMSQFIHREDQDIYYQHIKKLFKTAEPQSYDLRMVKSDGTSFWVHLEANAAKDTASAPVCRIVLTDITEHKLFEEVQAFLAKTSSGTSDESFFEVLARYLAQNLGMDFICIDRLEGDGLTARTVAVWCDGHFEDNVTYALKDTPCGDVVGKMVCCFPANVCQFFPRDQVLQDLRAESYVGVTLFDHTGHPIGLIAVIGRSPLANRRLAESMLKMVAVRAAGEMERLDAETALRESEELYRKVFMTSPDSILITRMSDGMIVSINKGFTAISGYTEEDVIGKTSLEINLWANPEDRRKIVEGLKTKGEVRDYEARFLTKDDEIYGLMSASIIELHGVPHILNITRNITARKRADEEMAKIEAQLQQAQKMESVGRLAGGVAHDFNNMLGIILGHTEMALDRLDPSQPLYAELEEIRSAAERSADLTRQLLAFARKQTVAPKVLDLNETVEGMLKMLRRLIGEDIDLNWRPEENLWPVKVDPSQIDQILANLCVNARDAISGVGKMTIETGNSTFDEEYCAAHVGFVPGEYVLLAVSDNGYGMDKETLLHLFEPFFTTKEMGKGTGLGLATVYGIVKQNNGFISVYSEPGQGTTFKIYLSRHLVKGEQLRKEAPAAPMVRGHETILLVEDEAAILAMTTMMLEKQGYTVLAASTPGEAIRLARERAGEIHLLMTDVVMPEMNGRDLAKNLLSLYPHLKRLFMSGYTADVIAHHGVLDEGVYFIQKPFYIKGLAAKVREALDSE